MMNDNDQIAQLYHAWQQKTTDSIPIGEPPIAVYVYVRM